ncbi:MAG: permease [Bacteroidales bacterium]|nr:permease [Bacteroidales bacterium]
MEYLKDFGREALLIMTEMGPWLMLGFIFAGILYLLFPKKRVKQYMGRNSRGAVVNASLLGIPLPLCSCGVIPTGLSFYRNGASRGSTVSFLISTPQTGVDSALADLLTGKLTIKGKSFDTDQLKKEIGLLGYRVIS